MHERGTGNGRNDGRSTGTARADRRRELLAEWKADPTGTLERVLSRVGPMDASVGTGRTDDHRDILVPPVLSATFGDLRERFVVHTHGLPDEAALARAARAGTRAVRVVRRWRDRLGPLDGARTVTRAGQPLAPDVRSVLDVHDATGRGTGDMETDAV